ncbi:hypothetical protein ACQPZ2_28795 [Nocardia pseudovaccinii]
MTPVEIPESVYWDQPADDAPAKTIGKLIAISIEQRSTVWSS